MTIQPAGMSPVFDNQGDKARLPQEKPELQEKQAPQDQVAISGQDQDNPGVAKKKWTVLLYSAADNNLEDVLLQDAMDLESVGSDTNTHVLLQIDRGRYPSSESGAWGGCRRFYLEKDSDSSNINSPVLEDLGQVNMADPRTLSEFVQWGVNNYPADHYFLIVSDHGGGWEGVIDDGSHGSWMKTKVFAEAIADAEKNTGKKLDIIGFDACLMASTEVGYELKDGANFLVASEETEGAEGWPYTQIFTSRILNSMQRALRQKLDMPADEVAKKIIKEAEGFQGDLPTLSAADLTKMKDLAAATDEFAGCLIATDTPKETIKSLIKQVESFSGFKDQYDFAEKMVNSPEVSDEALKAAAQKMMNAIKNTVIAEQHASDREGAHGLTVELPSWSYSPPDGDYKDLKFSQDTKWDEFLGKLGED